MADGLLWFGDDPFRLADKFSYGGNGGIDDVAADITNEILEQAEEEMRDIVDAGGMNATKKGGPRRDSDVMYDSISSKLFGNSRGRVQGEFGFINGPHYAIYQEAGTSSIASMLAFATVREGVIESMQQNFEQGNWLPKALGY
jgi:hypothetical protein